MRILTTTVIALLGLSAQSAAAEDFWSEELQTEIYAERSIAPAGDLVALDAPYRAMNDPRTPLGATVHAPDGERVRRVSLIIDNNPMPVSAVFDLAQPQEAFSFSAEMRLNGPTPVRVVMETDTGALYMTETFVKTSGVGACAAPPGTDPVAALDTLGEMELALAPADGTALAQLAAATGATLAEPNALQATLDIRHPSHSGLQMDQISLLYIPARYLQTLDVATDGRPLFTMTGSISLSENPVVEFEVPAEAKRLQVRMRDTGGADVEQVFPLVHG